MLKDLKNNKIGSFALTKVTNEAEKKPPLQLVSNGFMYPHPKNSYRPDIDGLRAFAVLTVIFYHLFPNFLPGGFVGVDVFFTISGYLISSIIFKDMENKNFKFSTFYARRIKRIFPTLLLILLFVSAAGWILMLNFQYMSLGKLINASTVFMANMQLHKEVGYFNPASASQPLLHIWSLSLEEQFYIFYPLGIYVLYKMKKFLLPALILGMIVSFAINIHFIIEKPIATFYFLPSRAWELLIGAVLSYYTIFKPKMLFSPIPKFYLGLSKNLISEGLSLLGFCLIMYACIALRATDSFPGWWALLPTIGTALLIANDNAWINKSILSHRVVVWVGLISYSLYLWHWPLIFLAHTVAEETTFTTRLAILLGSFVLAMLTTFYIEKPIRTGRVKALIPLCLAMVATFLFSLLISKGSISTLPILMDNSSQLEKISFAMNDANYMTENLNFKDKRNFPFESFGKGAKIIFFAGDSNLQQYWPRIEKIMLDNSTIYQKYTIVFAGMGSQVPVPGNITNPSAEKFLTKVEQYLDNPSIDTVVFGAQWMGYFTHSDKEKVEKLYKDLKEMLEKIKNNKKTIYFILNIPIEDQQGPNTMFERRFFSPWKVNTDKAYPREQWLSRSQHIMKRLRNIAESVGAIVIDPFDSLCPGSHCPVFHTDGFPIYRDACHLSAKYSRTNAMFIDRIFKDK